MFACPTGGLFVPTQRAADAFDFVGDDGFAIAGPAENDAAFEFAIGDGLGDEANENRIVNGSGLCVPKSRILCPHEARSGFSISL